MKGEWCYYKSYFTPIERQRIIHFGLKIPEQDGALGFDINNTRYDSSARRSKIRFIQKTDTNFTWLFDKMWKMVIESNDIYFKFHVSKLDYIQLAEYHENYKGEYKEHHDVFWINNDPEYHRKITAVVQLSNPLSYEGGDLEFKCLSTSHPNPQEIREQGSVIFFPSFIMHCANPVTKGVRYSLACWFDGPKWR